MRISIYTYIYIYLRTYSLLLAARSLCFMMSTGLSNKQLGQLFNKVTMCQFLGTIIIIIIICRITVICLISSVSKNLVALWQIICLCLCLLIALIGLRNKQLEQLLNSCIMVNRYLDDFIHAFLKCVCMFTLSSLNFALSL